MHTKGQKGIILFMNIWAVSRKFPPLNDRSSATKWESKPETFHVTHFLGSPNYKQGNSYKIIIKKSGFFVFLFYGLSQLKK